MAIDPHMQDIDDEPLDEEFEDRELVRAVARPHHVAPAQLIGLPVAAPAAARRGGNGGRAPGSDYPLRPRNAFYFDRRAAFEATVSVASEAGRQADAQEALNDAVGAVIDGLRNGAAVSKVIKDGLSCALVPVVEKLGLIDRSLVTIAGRGVDDAVAFFIVAFDSNGEVFTRTSVGQWIGRAGITHIDHIVNFKGDGRKRTPRDKFIALLLDNAPSFPGLPERMDAFDLGRVFDLARTVREVLTYASKPVPPDSEPEVPPPS